MTKKKSNKWKGSGKKPAEVTGKKGAVKKHAGGAKPKPSTQTPTRTPAPTQVREPAPDLPGGRLPLWAACAIVAIVAVVPYLNIFQNEFVSYDDEEFILLNETIRSLDAANVARMFASYIPGREHTADFPLTQLSWAVNYRLHGYEHWGYQFGNLLLHAIACLLLLALLRAGPWGAGAALWAAALWAAHPAHVESVTWMTARKDPLSVAFMFAAMLAYVAFVRGRGAKAAGGYAGAMALWGLALLAKPLAIVVPALLLVWVIFAEKRENLRRGLLGLAPFVPLAALFMWSQIQVNVERNIVKSSYFGGGFAMSQLTNGYVFLRYAEILLFPARLCAKYGLRVPEGLGDPVYLACWLAVIVAASVLVFIARKKPGILFYPLWFVAALLPVLQLVPTAGMYADRYLYVPSVAFCVGLAEIAKKFAAGWRVVAVAALAGLVVVYSGLTLSRNTVWRDSETLWNDTVAKNPASEWALNDLALDYYRKGDEAEAERLWKECIAIAPGYMTCYEGLGSMYNLRGDYEKAIEYMEKAVKIAPNNINVVRNLAHAYDKTGQDEKAITPLQKIAELQPDDEDIRYLLCVKLFALGRKAEALPHCESLVKGGGKYKGAAIDMYADALLEAGRYDEAAALKRSGFGKKKEK